MARRLIVTRHDGAAEWIGRRIGPAERFHRLEWRDLEALGPGDAVFGTLPAHLVAEICVRGARYRHLSLPVRPTNAELDADALERLGARLIGVEARLTGDDEAI